MVSELVTPLLRGDSLGSYRDICWWFLTAPNCRTVTGFPITVHEWSFLRELACESVNCLSLDRGSCCPQGWLALWMDYLTCACDGFDQASPHGPLPSISGTEETGTPCSREDSPMPKCQLWSQKAGAWAPLDSYTMEYQPYSPTCSLTQSSPLIRIFPYLLSTPGHK